MNKDENKIFVITKGEYSDYHIVRVFTTRKLANEFLDTKDNDYQLEVYDLDEPFDRKTNLYCISFQLDRKKVVYVHAYDNANPGLKKNKRVIRTCTQEAGAYFYHKEWI